jgi:AcrR family transcriptional regulator
MTMTKAEKTRQFIIEKSASIFNTKGIAATAMSDIATATTLTKGSLYVHFENKEELSLYAVDYNLEKFASKTLDAISIATTAKEKLFGILDFLSDPINHPIEGGCPMINFGTEADDTNPPIRNKIIQAMEDSIGLISSIIEEGKINGEFLPDWDTASYAIKMYATIEGGVMICRVIGSSKHMKVIVESLKNEIESMTIKK